MTQNIPNQDIGVVMSRISVIDLFSGVGGFSLGFHKFKEFQITAAIDLWEEAGETFSFNFPDIPFFLQDIRKINSSFFKKNGIKTADVVIGGPPCQGFSSCGTRKPDDCRNFLVLEFARIVLELKPKVFIMENVKGFLSMKDPYGILFKDKLKSLLHHEFNIQSALLKAEYYGVPQRRERFFMVGVRKDVKKTFKWPEQTHGGKDFIENASLKANLLPLVTVEDAILDLPNESSLNGEKKYAEPTNAYLRRIRRNAERIYNHNIPDHSPIVKERMSKIPPGGNWKNLPPQLRPGGNHSNLYKRLELDKPAVTIKHPIKSMIIHPVYNRCLSVREAARLQSFPDNFIFKGSKTSQYQQVANAVPPLLSEAIANKILELFS
jgi:DNA (cytosine-5)-methyltransferase 1